MGRKKLPTKELKSRISITISQELNTDLELLTNNKSKYIEELIIKDIKKRKNGK